MSIMRQGLADFFGRTAWAVPEACASCATTGAWGRRWRSFWRPIFATLFAHAALGCAGSAGVSSGPPPATSDVSTPGHTLAARLPDATELGDEVAEFMPFLDRAYPVLAAEPPTQPDFEVEDTRAGAQERMRRKMEAYFEQGLHFEDAQRLRATELVGALVEQLDAHPGAVLPSLLAALMLEDLAALGYDSAGSSYTPSSEPDIRELPVAMARAQVLYSALAAEAYGACSRAAASRLAATWAAYCDAGRRRMLLFAQQLPECTDASLLATAPLPVTTPKPPTRAGLLLLGNYGAPLLDDELANIADAVHKHLGTRVDLPWLPLAETLAPTKVEGICAASCRVSDTLFASHPDTRWYGLSLHCGEPGAACVLSVCGDGEDTCYRAQVGASVENVASWLSAVPTLAHSSDALLLETSGDLLSSTMESVAEVSAFFSELRTFGDWSADAVPMRQLALLRANLVNCQAEDRYAGVWTLQVDRQGKVTALRGTSDRVSYPMDQVVGPQDNCVAEMLRGVTFAADRTRRPTERRMVFRLDIPARIQVDVPFALRHDSAVSQLDGPARLGRDGFAVALAGCAARSVPPLRTLGVCLSVSHAGQIVALAVDDKPGVVPRVLAQLRSAELSEPRRDVQLVQQCLREVLPRFDWGCHPPGPEGHAAMTFAFPRSLLSRFVQPPSGAAATP